MYDLLVGCDVVALVATKGDYVYMYKGTLVEENESGLILKNCQIEFAASNSAKNSFFTSNAMFTIQSNIESIIINKEFVISCHKQ